MQTEAMERNTERNEGQDTQRKEVNETREMNEAKEVAVGNEANEVNEQRGDLDGVGERGFEKGVDWVCQAGGELDLTHVPWLRQYYEMYEQEVAALPEEVLSAPRPSTKLPIATKTILGITRNVVPKHLESLEGLLSEELCREARASGERTRTLAYALLYASAQVKIHGDAIQSTREAVLSHMTEATELCRVGKHWLGVLEDVGGIAPAVAARIRDGRGHMDTAVDLAQLSEIFFENLELLSTIQNTVQREDALRLDEEKIGRMGKLGTWLLHALSDDMAERERARTDWRRQAVGLTHLLERSYHLLRESVVFSLRLRKRFDEESSLPTFARILHVSRLSPRRGTKRRIAPEPESGAVEAPNEDEDSSADSSDAAEVPIDDVVE